MKRGNIFFENGLYDWSDAEIKHCEEIAVIKTRERLEQMKSRAKKYHDNDADYKAQYYSKQIV